MTVNSGQERVLRQTRIQAQLTQLTLPTELIRYPCMTKTY